MTRPRPSADSDTMRRRHDDHRSTWTPEDWAGRARMAAARLAAHGPDALDDLDREALTRSTAP